MIEPSSNLREHQKLSRPFSSPFKNIPDLLGEKVRDSEGGSFVFFPGESMIEYSYKDSFDRILRKREILKKIGLKKGDRLSIVLPNCSEFIELYFSSLSLGVILVPINPELNAIEIAYIANNSKSQVLIYDDALEFKINEQIFRSNKLISTFSVSSINLINTEESKDTCECYEQDALKIKNDDVAVIIYTSGTTGKPKGVLLNHMNLLADAHAIHDWFEFSKDTRTLCILPLFHNNGQVVTLLAPLIGGGSTVVVKASSSIASFWRLVRDYEITFTSLMSSILSILIAMPGERGDKTLKGIICGGQVMLQSVQDEFERRFAVAIYEGFGLTETTSFACFNNFPANKRRPSSIGLPLPCNEIKLIKESGETIDMPYVDGQMCVKGYNVCVEYLDLPDINKSKFKNGWFHTGDYGYRDEDGYYYFRGRKDFLIIKGGENIYPSEIENALYMHDAVLDVAAIGVNSNLLGQEIVAFVKLKQNKPTDEIELLEHCKKNIAKYKVPKKIYVLDTSIGLEEIPRGPTKKTLYNELIYFYNKGLKNEKIK